MTAVTASRLSITFGEAASAALLAIQRMTGIEVVSDVVRQALTVYRALLMAEKRGCQIILRAQDGQQFLYSLARPTEMVEIKGTPLAVPTTIDLSEFEQLRSNRRNGTTGTKDKGAIPKSGRSKRMVEST